MADRSERRSRHSKISPYADVELELTELTFHNFIVTLAVGGIGQVSATALLAAHYTDPWLWRLSVCMFMAYSSRITVCAVFAKRRSADLALSMVRRCQAIWAVLTIFFCTLMSIANVYIFSRYDMTGTSICIIGTFAICSTMSARITVQPRLSQFCGSLILCSLIWALFRNCPPLLGRMGALLCLFYAVVHCSTVQTKFEIVVDQLRTRRQMRNLAERDMLTGLANRRQFQARLTALCAELAPFAVLYIDLDHFKQVNDKLGHAMGDALLRHVSERLTSLIRGSDLLARLGGDEFAVLLQPVDGEGSVQALANRINDEIAAPFDIDGQQIEVGASIGICIAGAGDRDPTRLLSLADKALYSVKQAGRGGFRLGEFQN